MFKNIFISVFLVRLEGKISLRIGTEKLVLKPGFGYVNIK